MKTQTCVTLSMAIALLSLSRDLRADDAKAPDPRASDLGLILSVALGGTDDGSLMGVASAQAIHHSRLFGVRLASASRFELFGPSPTPSDTEYSALYGRYRARRKGYTSVSAGLSVVSAVRRGRLLRPASNCFLCSSEYQKVVTRTVGIPFEARAVLSSTSAGVGFAVMGNLNPKGSFVGVGMTFELGALR